MQIDIIDSHAPIWIPIHQLLDKDRFPQALLFSGPKHDNILQFVNRLAAIILCQQSNQAPCLQCKPCHLLMHSTHPDIQYISPDTPTGPIKIEQIRELQTSIYHTPQCGQNSIIIIESADRMNHSAANALLKVLEEPPTHIRFILIAEQMQSLPATILSRCQHYIFPTLALNNYVALGELYPPDSERAELFKQGPSIIHDLCELKAGKISVCTLSAKWSNYALSDVLWFLYLITAQAIRIQLLQNANHQDIAIDLQRFSESIEPHHLFLQLDKIISFINSIKSNITLNGTLALESLLMGY